MNGARSPVTASRWGGDDRGARAHLLPLAEHGCELAELSFPRVDGVGCVRVRTNLYSAPAKLRTTVEVRLYPAVEVRDQGRCIARHERQQQVLELEH
jgi:hypothetical protein